LQLKTRVEDKRKGFEKEIFQNCLDSLKSAVAIIYELNNLCPKDKFASNKYINQYFNGPRPHEDWTAESLKVHVFMLEVNTSIKLFNDNKITDNAYQTIILTKIDVLLHLVRGSILGSWNKQEQLENNESSPVLYYSLSEQFLEIKIFYDNIKNLKVEYKDGFDENFRVNEILKLKSVCNWFNDIEPVFIKLAAVIVDNNKPVNEVGDKKANEGAWERLGLDDDVVNKRIEEIMIPHGLELFKIGALRVGGAGVPIFFVPKK
jgi:hypothetical protein